jgi:hypothetical protein
LHRRKAFPGGRARGGEWRQEGLQRIHQPAFFPEGKEGHGWGRAGQLGQEFAEGVGTIGKRRIDKRTAWVQTAQGVLEGGPPTQFVQFQEQQLAEIVLVHLTPSPGSVS